jgi:UDP-N-acetylmuramoyl-tripeptide--D-alanyl-D-alanine ligase
MKAGFRRLLASVFARQARRLIKRHHLIVVAVCGSVGKTSTRSAIVTVLRQKLKTQAIHHPGYNSELGLPLSIFEMRTPDSLINPFAWAWRLIQAEIIINRPYAGQVLVLELGTDHPGEIDRYLRYLQPDVGVITAITPEHMENFESLDAVAAEELKIVSACKYLLASASIPAHYKKKFIGVHPHHDYYGTTKHDTYQIAVSQDDPVSGMTCTISKSGHKVIKDLSIGLFGESAALSALAAFAVADHLGLSSQTISKGLGKLKPVAGRMQVMKGENDSILIDDTYNSSPAAVEASLQALYATSPRGRRIAILGSMNELGAESKTYHEQIGPAAAGVDLLLTVGDLANKYLGPSAVKAGLDPTRFQPADSPIAAAEFLRLTLHPGDIVLIKGSQNQVFLEEAVKRLLADKSDQSRLVRQSKSWLKIKSKQFSDI